jgi:hypothetical protein
LEEVLRAQLGGDLGEDLRETFEPLGDEGAAAGRLGELLHAVLRARRDDVQAKARPARVDRVEDGVGTLHVAQKPLDGPLVRAARLLAHGLKYLLRGLVRVRLLDDGVGRDAGRVAHVVAEVVLAVGDDEDDAAVALGRVLREVAGGRADGVVEGRARDRLGRLELGERRERGV